MKLQTKLLLIIISVLLVSFVTTEFIHYVTIKSDILSDLRREGRNIRSVLMSTRRVYHHQFLDSGVPLTDKTLGFLPAHAMSRISEDFRNWTESSLYFNNVSDRPRNPDNAADQLEMEAIKFFRDNPAEKERFVPFKSKEDQAFYHFSTPIWLEEYCIKCHGKREDSPVTIRTDYTTAFNYEVGELRGIMSIKLPVTQLQAHVWANLQQDLWIHLCVFTGIFFLISWLLRRYVTVPVSRLAFGLQMIGDGKYEQKIEKLPLEMVGVDSAFNLMVGNLHKREDALRESEERFKAITTAAQDAIIMVDDEMKVVYWNRSATKIFGFSDDEAIEKDLHELIFIGKDSSDYSELLQVFKEAGHRSVIGRTTESIAVRKNEEVFPIEISVSSVKFKGKWNTIWIARDISGRKREQEMLKANQEQLQGILDNTTAVIYIKDLQYRYVLINKQYQNLFHITLDEISGKTDHDLFPKETADQFLANDSNVLEARLPIETEETVLQDDGIHTYISTKFPLLSSDGIPYGVCGISTDITERNNIEEQLRRSESQLAESQVVSKTGSWDLDLTSQELDWSDETYTLFDKDPKQFKPSYDKFVRMVHPDDLKTMQNNYNNALVVGGKPYHVVVRIINDSGRAWVMEAFGEVRRSKENNPIRFLGTAQDISERRRTEEKLRSAYEELKVTQKASLNVMDDLIRRRIELDTSLQQKEVLLKEVHHRVKNNMQVIISLLRHQSDCQDDKKLIEIFDESQNRIKSMSLIHEKLYSTEDLARIDFSDYVTNLANDLFRFYKINTSIISLSIDVRNVMLNIDTAIPCGLIINEFVTNSLKYAFPFDSVQGVSDNKKGRVEISMCTKSAIKPGISAANKRQKSETEFELILSDNGIGIPKEIDYRNTETLGLSLIFNLTEHQLGGKIELDGSSGTRFKIRFRDGLYKKRI